MAAPTAGYSLETSSSSSASGQSRSGFDNSGFVVNFGGKGGVTTAAAEGAPAWVWVALLAGALWLFTKKA